uniref:Stress response protein NST1-like n=1 Tax=Nicotiana sylvestris TaxID=4096 RepID=A0A1U7XS21_NICSY|nr:PREDICTED: stress response protein NST1-like [Nicotiana sylvestris]
MKRKKWSEMEEQTLLTKYSDLLNSGTLAKLKTREKKFKPIADHVNSVHHLQDPLHFPFKWSWRDVSIKVQNMRHQYLGVKQKIRNSNNEFNWKDGENHWENFLKYKEVFGDVELDITKEDAPNNDNNIIELYGAEGVLGLGFGIDSEEFENAEEDDEDGGSGEGEDMRKGFCGKRIRMVGEQVFELRDVLVRREEKRREREWSKEKGMLEREERRKEMELCKDRRDDERDEEIEMKGLMLEERQMMWAKRECEKRLRLEREFDEERRRRMKLEEKWEEEEMEWRERLVNMQIEHEKQMMQMHADACQNQTNLLGIMARLVCQFFGSANDGLGGGLGTLSAQVLQNLHPGGLNDAGKPDAASPSEFL